MKKGNLTKLCLLRRHKKAHSRKGNILVAFNIKKYFSNLAESSKFTYYCQNQFFCGYTSTITHFFYNSKMEWWFIKLHSYFMINKIQIFLQLLLALVTFRPILPYIVHYLITGKPGLNNFVFGVSCLSPVIETF